VLDRLDERFRGYGQVAGDLQCAVLEHVRVSVRLDRGGDDRIAVADQSFNPGAV